MMLPMAGLLMTLAVVLGVRRLWLTPERALAWLALRGGASIALEELALFDEGAGRWRRAELLYAELLERRLARRGVGAAAPAPPGPPRRRQPAAPPTGACPPRPTLRSPR